MKPAKFENNLKNKTKVNLLGNYIFLFQLKNRTTPFIKEFYRIIAIK